MTVVCMTNLFVEPEHRARHSDVSKADPLSHKEGTGVQVLVQHSKDPLHILLRLLCGLDRSRQKDDYAELNNTQSATWTNPKSVVLWPTGSHLPPQLPNNHLSLN